jgi:alpha-L-arabinofuranosidase
MMTTRRSVLAAGAAALLTSRKGFTWAAEKHSISIRTGSSLGVIRPELHGHFAEHLGKCIYGGLWVGERSAVPNVNGYHAKAVEYLKAVGIPVLRWPGGCFADDYHWRDGIGPAEKRPSRVNVFWGYDTEDNSFGTHEFIGLCRHLGAQPYLAGNVGSGTPQELRNWVEYCNYPSGSTLSKERVANGSPEPFGVRYWGVGNENWGCGGNMTAEEYAALYRRFAIYVATRPNSFGTPPFLIACGPNKNDVEWTTKFFETLGKVKVPPRMPSGYAMHFYAGGKAPATKFTPELMADQFSNIAQMEAAIVQQRELMDKYDPKRNIGLMVDEWGVWDRIQKEDEERYGKLFQPIPMRAAIVAALGLNVFHRQAGKLVMCNIAQTVNVLHSMLLIDGPRCVRTTSYWAFDLMKAHRGATSLEMYAGSPSPGLSVSASQRENSIAITMVNPSHEAGAEVNCAVLGAKPSSAEARILHHSDYNAGNDWEESDRIVPRKHAVEIASGTLRLTLPPLAIATVTAKV